jgi:hypothetical protein
MDVILWRIPAVLAALLPAADRPCPAEVLRLTREEFHAAIAGLSPEQWIWTPAPGRWSVAAVAEHLVRAEELLLDLIRAALDRPPDPHWLRHTRGKTELLWRVVPEPLGRASAPFATVPRADRTADDAAARFDTVRTLSIRCADELPPDADRRTSEHGHPVFNWLSAPQGLLYIALHTRRHVSQIAGIRSGRRFP